MSILTFSANSVAVAVVRDLDNMGRVAPWLKSLGASKVLADSGSLKKELEKHKCVAWADPPFLSPPFSSLSLSLSLRTRMKEVRVWEVGEEFLMERPRGPALAGLRSSERGAAP